MNVKVMSRRALLRSAGLAGLALAAAAAGCQPKVVTVKETVVVEKAVKETVVVEKAVKETVVVEKQVEVTSEVKQAAKEAIVITVHQRLGTIADQLIFFAQKFNQSHYPDVFVKIEATPYADYFQKLDTMIVAGTIGDAFELFQTGGFQQYAATGVYAAMDDLVAAAKYDLGQFFPECVDMMRWEGKLYALPWGLHIGSAAGLYFNKTVLDAANMPYPTSDWTWDELIGKAQALTDPVKGIYGLLCSQYYAGTPVTLARAYGGDLLSQDGMRCTLTTEETRAGLQIMSDLYNKWKVAAPRSAITDSWQMFVSGKIAMMETGFWGSYAGTLMGPDEWGVVATPRGPKGRGNTTFVDMFGVTSASKHPSETFDYLTTICSYEAGMDLWQVRKSVPGARPDVWNSKDALADPNFRVYSEMVATDGIPPALPLPANFREKEYWAAMDSGLDGVHAAEKTLDQVIDSTQKACQDVLDKSSLI